MFVGAEHAVGLTVIAIEHLQRVDGRVAIGGLARHQRPERRGLQRHRDVDAVRAHAVVGQPLGAAEAEQLVGGLVRERKRVEVRPPVRALRLQRARQIQQARVGRPVEEPDDGGQFVGPAIDGPVVQRPAGGKRGVMREVARERRHDAWIAGGLLVLREHLEHHHVRPPVGVALRAEPPGVGLIGQRPLHVALGLGDERGVLQQIGERHQAVEIVRPALPAFAGASEPSAVGAHVGPELVEPPGEATRLNLQLSFEPALRPHRSQRQQRERAGLQRHPIADDTRGRRRRIRLGRSRAARALGRAL